MLKIENVEIHGWEPAVRGMRNPKNSWAKSDSTNEENCEECIYYTDYTVCKYNPIHECLNFKAGPDDLELMTRLCSAGTDHRKFLRMITVYADVTAPLYWWKEYDTYKVGTVANSCSTMHKIAEKEFTMDDFSHEHLVDIWDYAPEDRLSKAPTIQASFRTEQALPDNYFVGPKNILEMTLSMLNRCRELYQRTNDKTYWWQMIQLLPSSYNQRRTLMLNYEVLANIYPARRNHKLDEWHTFCDWIEGLPYSELITGKEEKND